MGRSCLADLYPLVGRILQYVLPYRSPSCVRLCFSMLLVARVRLSISVQRTSAAVSPQRCSVHSGGLDVSDMLFGSVLQASP
jgi:hypothetical protein